MRGRPRSGRANASAALALMVASCGSPTPAPTTATHPEQTTAPATASDSAAPLTAPAWSVELTELPTEDAWRATYRFSDRIAGLAFEGRLDRARAERWVVEEPPSGTEWQRRGKTDLLVSTTGDGFDRLVVRFPSNFENQRAGYELNARFSDSGRVIFLGHVEARPVTCAHPAPRPCTPVELADDAAVEWALVTDANRHIAMPDRRGTGRLAWRSLASEKAAWTYGYFGPAKPQAFGAFDAVFDPGLPMWMRDASIGAIPKLFDLFATRTRSSLPFRPLFVVSHEANRGTGRDSGGGVAGRGVRLASGGSGWAKPERTSRQEWLGFVAHETFHLWNGQLHRRRFGMRTDSWLSEGAAVYFALRAQVELGLKTERELEQELVTLANRCALMLRGRSLLRSHRGKDRPAYTCGPLMLRLAEGSLRRRRSELWSVFALMFEKARRDPENRYSTYDFLEQLEVATGDPSAAAPLQRILQLGMGSDPAKWLEQELGRAGIDVQLVDYKDAGIPDGEMRWASPRQLSRCDCDGRTSITRRRDHYQFHGEPECRLFSTEHLVTHVGDHTLLDAPAEALTEVARAARANRVIVLRTLGGKRVKLRCRKEAVHGLSEKALGLAPTP